MNGTDKDEGGGEGAAAFALSLSPAGRPEGGGAEVEGAGGVGEEVGEGGGVSAPPSRELFGGEEGAFVLSLSPAGRPEGEGSEEAVGAGGEGGREEGGGVPPSRELFGEEGGGVSAVKEGGGLWRAVGRFFADEEEDEEAEEAVPARLRPSWYYWIFFLSGFAGLIYESIWARYLKLLLGHAAYAQALALVIFLFGLAAGAALVGRVSDRVRRPLLWYAGIEVVLALLAVYFHEIFVAAEQWAVGFMLPQIESDAAAEIFKWTLAAALVLPQSILLGTTFPLMSAGVARLWPEARGRIVAMLYFSNSLGAVFGVLAAAFVLLPVLGLPGSIALAGLLNAAAAAAVWILGHLFDDTGAPIVAAGAAPTFGRTPLGAGARFSALITAVAFGTGMASFVYEIVWVRMLSLLFGASTVTFEVMLAVFILGLALGGLAARRRADEARGEILHFVGNVQVAMGVLALGSLFCFPWFYEILRDFLSEVPRNGDGYRDFLLLQLGLSAVMMLPAAFCAGMTLPLLTRRLIDAGGESAIGRVYAANTLGAIFGVLAAVHVLLPHAGMQGALMAGAFVDMLIGVALIGVAARWRFGRAVAVTVAALAVAGGGGEISERIAAVGVFRHQVADEKLPNVVFYRDGKTASISVSEHTASNGVVRAIATNGKIDAGLVYGGTAGETGYQSDEITMVMLGMLPLMYKPDAARVMNIGFGSGMTSRVLLLSRNVRQLDNVEIEAAMLDGARRLGGRVTPVFEDPRNKFIINDAKTVMARSAGTYDVIVSEPSNPWVSGVAGLFTREFYRRARTALAPDGIFVQWMPLYESDPALVASVVGALSESFADFDAYISSRSDLIFVASASGELPEKLNAVFAHDKARAFLGGYRFRSTDDVDATFLGRRQELLPYFESFLVPINSDYHPYLEVNAARAFFLNRRYALNDFLSLPVPVLEVLGAMPSRGDVQAAPHSVLRTRAALVAEIYANREEEGGVVQEALAGFAGEGCPLVLDEEGDGEVADGGEEAIDVDAPEVDAERYLLRVSELVSQLMPVLNRKEMADVWAMLEEDACIVALLENDDDVAGVYTRFWRALSLRDFDEVILTSESLLPQAELYAPSGQILLLAAMAAHYRKENHQRVVALVLDLPQNNPAVYHAARLLAANSAEKI